MSLRRIVSIFLICSFTIVLGVSWTMGQLASFRPAGSSQTKKWVQKGFSEFRQGEAEDGGVNLYVTATGTVRSVYTFDYNSDGANDILFVNAHDINDAPDTYIYLNSEEGVNPRYRWSLLNEGAYSGAVGDLNKDGYADLVLCGTTNGNNKVALNSYIYYGTERGFVPGKVTRLPTYMSYSVGIGDFNGDGWEDLVYSQKEKPLLIYWNSPEGFKSERSTELRHGGWYCRTVDVDKDGHIDIVVMSGGKESYPQGPKDGELLTILRGTGKGIDEDGAVELKVSNGGRFAVGDLDKDGQEDLVVSNTSSERGKESEIIWGGKKGFDERPRVKLQTQQAMGCAIADLNGDGWADLVFANQAEEDYSEGKINSYIYWGGAAGYKVEKRTELPTEWASQVVTGDLNRDGYMDIAFASRISEYSMTGKSRVYLGSAAGFSAERRIELVTHGPLDACIADVNNDKYADLIYFNAGSGSISSMESVIHWNDGKGNFSDERVTKLRTWDSIGSAAADFNQDGYIDIALPNSYEFGKWRHGQASFIYWGGPDGFSDKNKQILKTQSALTVNTGDLNKDGYLDLLITQWQQGGKNVIYWGSKSGFSDDRTSNVYSTFTVGSALADLNKDGWLDIVFSNYSSPTAPIYWGGPQGYSKERVSQLPNEGTNAAVAADLNNDGWLDLVMTMYSQSDGGNEGYSYIYWGSANGFDGQRRTGLPSVGAVHTTVADFNKDGFLDLVICNESTGVRDRTWFAYVYWNGPKGFNPARRTNLFTYGGAGSLALDFNKDGWLDLVVSNHKAGSTHRTNSYLIWGSPSGFDETQKVEFPTSGANETTFYDAGNIYDRKFATGFQSKIFDAGSTVQISKLGWTAEEKFNSKLKFQIRAANSKEELLSKPWSGPQGSKTYYETPQTTVSGPQGRYLQYRALFTSEDGSNYPELSEVVVEYK